MKRYIKNIASVFLLVLILFNVVCCGKNKISYAEKITLGETVFGEVEFKNADTVKFDMTNDGIVISGKIEAMSLAQKSAFGVNDVTHVVVLKFMFDKERTIKTFELKGNTTKVFSSDNTVENYVGSLNDLLDNEEGEDAFCYLVLSANTKNYTLTSKYTDGQTVSIKVVIDATLVSANPD